VKFRPDDPARGPADAKLTIVLFSDFQCPFCARVEPSLKQLEETFPGKLRIVWKHQPLPMHPDALPAAVAAEAAREQGKFWQMHARLFESQRALDGASLARYAKEIGLDVRRYQQSLAASKAGARIQEDKRLAEAVDASGTPTMFFNCRQVVGARPFDQLRTAAEEELKKADALLGGKKPDAGFYERACKANLASAPAAAAPVPAGAAGALAPAPSRSARTTRCAGTPRRGDARPLLRLPVSVLRERRAHARRGAEAVRRQVRIVWKHQPLSFHPNAFPAAEAAEAAREQGKFWQMPRQAVLGQRELSPETYERSRGRSGST